MNRRFSILAITLLLAASMGLGCIGNFALTGKVRQFNLETTQDRWEREGLFVLLYVLPVYPFAGSIDLIIINSIEFWTGTNPIDQSKSVSPVALKEWTTEDGTQISMLNKSDDSVDVTLVSASGETRFVNLSQTDEGITARDASGEILISSADLPLDQLEPHI